MYNIRMNYHFDLYLYGTSAGVGPILRHNGSHSQTWCCFENINLAMDA